MPEELKPSVWFHPVEVIHREAIPLNGNLYLTVEAWRLAHDEERIGHALNNIEMTEAILSMQKRKSL